MNQVQYVKMGEIKKIDSATVIKAGPVNPSLAIGIYNKQSGTGYVSRMYAGEHNQLHLIKRTICAALDDLHDKNDLSALQIVIAGANETDNKQDKMRKSLNRVCRDTWREIYSIVESYDFKENQIRYFNGHTDSVFDLSVDLIKGEIHVEEAKDIAKCLNKVKQ